MACDGVQHHVGSYIMYISYTMSEGGGGRGGWKTVIPHLVIPGMGISEIARVSFWAGMDVQPNTPKLN